MRGGLWGAMVPLEYRKRSTVMACIAPNPEAYLGKPGGAGNSDHGQAAQLVGHAPASRRTHTGAAAPGTLQHISHGGQQASPQQT
jgi:hypothetical protein